MRLGRRRGAMGPLPSHFLVAAADARKGKSKRNGGSGKHHKDHEIAADKNRVRRRNAQCKRKKAKACAGRCGTVTLKCKKRNGKTKRTPGRLRLVCV